MVLIVPKSTLGHWTEQRAPSKTLKYGKYVCVLHMENKESQMISKANSRL